MFVFHGHLFFLLQKTTDYTDSIRFKRSRIDFCADRAWMHSDELAVRKTNEQPAY